MNPTHFATITLGADPLGRDNTVTLIDGAVVSTWSEEWRTECADRYHDAQYVLSLSTREARRRHLDVLSKRRGAVYRARLEAEILKTWERRRAAAGDH